MMSNMFQFFSHGLLDNLIVHLSTVLLRQNLLSCVDKHCYIYINDQLVSNYNDGRQSCLMLVVLSQNFCGHNMTSLASYFTVKMNFKKNVQPHSSM